MLAMSLLRHQEEGVTWMREHPSCIVADDPGCVSGDTMVSINRRGATLRISVRELHYKFHGGATRGKTWNRSWPTKIRVLLEGMQEFGLHTVKDVIDSGDKQMLRMSLRSGKSIKLTEDHAVLTPNGWVNAGALVVGDVVVTNGKTVCSRCGTSGPVSKQNAKFPGVCKACVYGHFRRNGRYKTGTTVNERGYVVVSGQQGHPRSRNGKMYQHVLVAEQQLGRLLLSGEHVHHINGNKGDNRPESLRVMSDADHLRLHRAATRSSMRGNHGRVLHTGGVMVVVPEHDEVVSVEPAGVERAYDIACDDPHHNFVANGIVVHNCGKTPMTLVALDAPALIVCPASLRVNWGRELQKWRPSVAQDVHIVGYEELAKKHELQQRTWATLVVDEAHRCKNLKIRKRGTRGPISAVAVYEAAKRSARRILLTGTPIMNRPLELYPLLKLVEPDDWGSEFDFGRAWCNGKQVQAGWTWFKTCPSCGERTEIQNGRWAEHRAGRVRCGASSRQTDYKGGTKEPRLAWDFSGISNADRLHSRIQRHMLRRLKTDVLNLPVKRRRSLVVNLTGEHERAYVQAETDFRRWVYKQKGIEGVKRAMQAEAITQMTALRALAAAGKVDHAVDFAMRHHVAMNGRPLVIMGHHTETLQAIGARLSEGFRVGYVLGGMTDKQRQKAIDAFQGGDIDIIVCSLRAASVGLTLTRGSEMLIVERDFRPGDNLQAEDRIHRVSQERDVIITYLDASGTIDVTMGEMLRDKTRAASAIIDGEELDEEQAVAQVMGRVAGTLEARPQQWSAQQTLPVG